MIIFWVLVAIVFYTYLGYALIICLLAWINGIFKVKNPVGNNSGYEPAVTLFIAAYNESESIKEKIQTTRELDYPKEKLKCLWVTDGSDDGSNEILKQYQEVEVLHEPKRNGKIGAINRGMKYVKTPIVIFSDANTTLSRDSIRRISSLFRDPNVGCVSGEKRICSKEVDSAAGAGEGFYWRYESLLKKWEGEITSPVGAAGELFAIRTELYKEQPQDTILDDFMISMQVVKDGYDICYDPEAFAIEMASADIHEELKRKSRISAGGLQALSRLLPLLNVFKYGFFSFQFISHRILRWTLAPLALIFLIPISSYTAFETSTVSRHFYIGFFYVELIFLLLAMTGWFLRNHEIRWKVIFVPLYFVVMNLSEYIGLYRYFKRSQGVNWERSKRAI